MMSPNEIVTEGPSWKWIVSLLTGVLAVVATTMFNDYNNGNAEIKNRLNSIEMQIERRFNEMESKHVSDIHKLQFELQNLRVHLEDDA